MDPELPATEAPDPVVPAEESTTLSEHEAQYSEDAPAPPPDAASATTETPDPDERDAQGRFKGRHRAKSQQAAAADVPRIQELTRKLREAEAERDALKAAPKPPEPVREPPKPVPPPPIAATTEIPPKPTRDQFDDYDLFVEAVADWKADRKWETHQAAQVETAKQQQAASDLQRLQTAWKTKVDAALLKYPDFKAVALEAPTTIRSGSLIDAWILEHKHGADVLYSLQQSPTEIQRIDALSPIEQAEELTLLGQRLNPPSRTSAGTTGSATPPALKLAPRPPNPVRTGPIRTGDDPPDDATASLLDHEKFYGSGPRRR
jgi:hypothetical protein